MKNTDTIGGLLAVIVVVFLLFAFSFGILMLIAKLICIVSLGLFSYSLEDKYWYVVLLVFIISCFTGKDVVTVNKGE